jgi:hypothetical protein
MITLDWVKGLLETTGYSIEYTRDKEPNTQELLSLPVVYVGYASLDSTNPNAPIAYDLFNLHGEDLVQSFDVLTVCEVENLHTVWRKLYSSLIGKHPTLSLSSTASTSGLTYAQGGVIGLSNGKLWWLDRWKIGFPTTNVLL